MSDYHRVEQAMVYMTTHQAAQPSLEEVAEQVHLSPFHFQRLFSRWAGVSPKRFLQALMLERAKRLLDDEQALLEASHSLGLSASSRLHDHFVRLEAVTPGEYKNRGQGVPIEYGCHDTPLGRLFVAVTPRGVCRVGFVEDTGAQALLAELRESWPLSDFFWSPASTRYVIDAVFAHDPHLRQGPLSLHVVGTNFQVAVWRALLRIPEDRLASYSQIARALGSPKASRAVGNAVGANPVALLIPCHRVIQQSGALGGYRWGPTRKRMLQTWEQAHFFDQL